MTTSGAPQSAMGDDPGLRRMLVWSLCGLCGLLAIVGADPNLTLFVVLLAILAVIVNHAAKPGVVPEGRASRPGTPECPLVHQESITTTEPTDRVGPVIAVPTAAELTQWSDEAVCQAWRASYGRLRRMENTGHPGPALARVALERARYLDELERRHPSGFSAWIAAGARAPSDPTPYLARRPSPHQLGPQP